MAFRRGARRRPRPDGCRSGSRRLGRHQRPDQTRRTPQRPPLHDRRHRSLNGRIHGLRRLNHEGRKQTDVRLPGSARHAVRPLDRRRGPRRTLRIGLCRSDRQDSGRRRLDARRCRGGGSDRPVRLLAGPGRSARSIVRPRRGARRGCRKDRTAGRRAAVERLRHAGRPVEPPRLRGRTPVQPPVGHGAPAVQRSVGIPRIQGRNRDAGLDGLLRNAARSARRNARHRPLRRRLEILGRDRGRHPGALRGGCRTGGPGVERDPRQVRRAGGTARGAAPAPKGMARIEGAHPPADHPLRGGAAPSAARRGTL